MESEPRELYILDEVIKTLNEIRINGEGELNLLKGILCLADEVIKTLNEIRINGEGELNLLKGILCLANEIKKLKQDSLGASSVVWE